MVVSIARVPIRSFEPELGGLEAGISRGSWYTRRFDRDVRSSQPVRSPVMSDKREPHRGVVVKTSAGDAAVQLERLISKQKYKDAVKQAKLIHKAEATPQSHRQLERAYFLRAQQLLRAGMPASAVEVSRHLLD